MMACSIVSMDGIIVLVIRRKIEFVVRGKGGGRENIKREKKENTLAMFVRGHKICRTSLTQHHHEYQISCNM